MNIQRIAPENLIDWCNQYGSIDRIDRKWSSFIREDVEGNIVDPVQFVIRPIHSMRYLYRGQTRRFVPCLPTLCRGMQKQTKNIRELSRTDLLSLITGLMRANSFCKTLSHHHPALSWSQKQNLSIDRMALAQHYGLPTGYVDMSESLEVACFFATCAYNSNSQKWTPCDRGVGIAYRIDYLELHPLLRRRLRPIGLHPFPRPYEQWGWTLEMFLGDEFESFPGVQAVEFEQTIEVSQFFFKMFDEGRLLFPEDPLATWADYAINSNQLPESVFHWVIDSISQDPKGVQLDADKVSDEISSLYNITLTNDEVVLMDNQTAKKIEKSWQERKAMFLDELQQNWKSIFTR